VRPRDAGGDQLYLIDSLAPFFVPRRGGEETNWSKVPFGLLEDGAGGLDEERCGEVERSFGEYVQRVAALGYNAITVDDLAHLTSHEWYPPLLCAKLRQYADFYGRLLGLAAAAGLRVFMNTDVMFLSEAIAAHTRMSDKALLRLLARSLRQVFENHPEVHGVVLRVGESDGVDVHGDFDSALTLRTPRQMRRWLRRLLEVCVRFDRQLIVRTWTLGAYPLGDLMWNPKTYHQVFDGFDDEHLIVSHKHGESDFFRYLNFNPLFYEGEQRRIIEVQARREYEGCGLFPAFGGFEYERWRRYLDGCENVVGVSVWCQTGGWGHFDSLTFVRQSSLWNEMNVHAAIAVFRDGLSAEAALVRFSASRFPGRPPTLLVDLMRLAERVVRDLWYLPEYSARRIYFRRTRVPPLLWVYWDTIIINHTMRKVLRRFVHERREAISDGWRTLEKVRGLQRMAERLGIGADVFEFQYDTFRLLALAREYFFGPWRPHVAERIKKVAEEYRVRYPLGFHVEVDFRPVRLRKRIIKIIFGLCLRTRPAYRLFDLLVLNRFAGLIYLLLRPWYHGRLPSFARTQAMGIQTILK
jgi:hypothetical protein